MSPRALVNGRTTPVAFVKTARRRGVILELPETIAMMPKVTLKAPAGVGGQIHASKSSKNYTIAEDGTVTVDSTDVSDLVSAGFQAVPHDGGPDSETAAPITSHSTTADTQGATALDPDAREALRREATESEAQHSEDHGNAVPPHGIARDLGDDSVTQAHRKADSDLTAETAERSGAPASAKSADANTGDATHPAGSEEQQDKAAEEAKDDDKAHDKSKRSAKPAAAE